MESANLREFSLIYLHMRNSPQPPGWLRRLGCGLAAVGWLAAMSLPCLIIGLAMAGELGWRRGPYNSDRLWLIQQVDERGLGYSAERILSDRRAEGGPVCVRTRVRFFMWRGQGDPADYCECYAPDGAPLGACP